MSSHMNGSAADTDLRQVIERQTRLQNLSWYSLGLFTLGWFGTYS